MKNSLDRPVSNNWLSDFLREGYRKKNPTTAGYKQREVKISPFFKKSSSYRFGGKLKKKQPEKGCIKGLNVVHSSDKKVVFKLKGVNYYLHKYHRSNQDLLLSHRPCVAEGDWVQKGDLLSDCASSVLGDLAVGKNVLVGYMPWEGYNFEDAIVLSQRMVYENVYTSLHIERYEVQIQETATGFEKITRQVLELVAPMESNRRKIEHVPHSKKATRLRKLYLYGLVARSKQKSVDFRDTKKNYQDLPNIFHHLDENGVVNVGTWVRSNDVLVGKVTPLAKRELLPQERFFYDVIERRPPEFKDTSFRVPKNVYGRVIGKAVFDSTTPDFGEKLSGPKHVCVYIAEQRQIQIGDKLAGRHGNKGIVSIILPREEMPYLPDGTPLDIVLNPLGVPSRMNVGQVFESLLGLAGRYLKQQFKIPPFDETIGPEASRSLVFSKLYEAMVKTRKEWLFQYDTPGKVSLFDGRTGESFDQLATIGQAYMLKLIHIVDKKIHARSVGPYALVTQQPVRGRSKQGGQRLGEMEVWALEGFGAAYTLQECLTLKSDDLLGRDKVLPAISKEKLKLYMGTPEAFRVAVRELQSLCLKVSLLTSKSFLQKQDETDLQTLNKKEGLFLTDVAMLP